MLTNFADRYGEELFEVKAPTRDGVLGTVIGPGFFPNLPSRNKRVYPTEAWTNALSNDYTKRILESSLMLGTVGHKDMDFDELICEQKVSHVTRRLWMEEKSGKKVGMIEADILDTPVGRILNTLMRAGCKMAVSSKSYGEYQESKDSTGNQIVDPKKFFCQRFDFVVDPGFLDAQPQLKEEFEHLIHTSEKNNTEDTVMEKEMLELMKEKTILEGQLGVVLKENESLKSQVATYTAIGTVEGLKVVLETAKQYEAVGEITDITTALESFKDFMEKVGTPDECTETLERVKEFMEAIKEFGSVEDIATMAEDYSIYQEIGTVEEIQEALEKAKALIEKLEPIGTYATIKEALEKSRDVLKEYAEIGKPAEIKEAFTKSNEILDGIKATTLKKETDEIVTTFGVTEEKAKGMVEKVGAAAAKELLKDISESVKVTTRYTVKKDKDGKVIKEKVPETRVSRLYDSFAGTHYQPDGAAQKIEE